jgi:protein-tyrosine phosphatase
MKRTLLVGAAALTTAFTLNQIYARYRAYQQASEPFDAQALRLAHAELRPEKRIVTLPGAFNVRDIGGYTTQKGQTVRWGQVYRAGTLSNLTDEGVARLSELGIQTICDVRTTHEAETQPARLPEAIRYVHIPLHERGEGRGRILFTVTTRPHRISDLIVYGYITLMIEKRAHLLADIIRRIADPANRPILLHCTAGKDRTGLTIALLLALLGVPDDTILADFSLSNLFYEEVRQTIQRDAERLAVFGIRAGNLRPMLVADPETLRVALAYVRRRYGSVDGYVRGRGGLSDATLQQLRVELLAE